MPIREIRNQILILDNAMDEQATTLLEKSRLTNLTNHEKWRTIEAVDRAMEAPMAGTQVNLYEAKTHLSSLVDRAAKGEEFVIAKGGKQMARLTPLASKKNASKLLRKPGQNLLGITYIADDFDAPLPEDVLQDFGL